MRINVWTVGAREVIVVCVCVNSQCIFNTKHDLPFKCPTRYVPDQIIENSYVCSLKLAHKSPQGVTQKRFFVVG